MTATICRIPDCGAQAGGAFMCRACLAELDRAIGDYAGLLHEVSLLATKQTRVYRTNGQAQPEEDWDAEESALPAMLRSKHGRITLPTTATMVNLGARDLFDEATNLIVTWARHLSDDKLDVDTMPQLYGWLLKNITEWRWDEAGPEAHQQITAMHQRMTRAVDRSASRVYAGPCDADLGGGPRCTQPLYNWPWRRRDDGSIDPEDTVECDGWRPPFELTETSPQPCGAVHTYDERIAWLLADLETQLLPLSILQQTLPSLMPALKWPTRSTWWKWVQPDEQGRRTLTPRTKIGEVEYFNGAEVISLVIRQQKRIVANVENHRTRSKTA